MSKPLDLADLDYAVEGPDRRFQDHGPGCRCGNVECPWARGMMTVRRFREEMTTQERNASWREACVAMTGPPPGILGG